jgi:hypothetical protein
VKIRGWAVVVGLVVFGSALFVPEGRSAQPKRRTEAKQYIVGSDVASDRTFVCPLSVGGACFDLQPRDRRMTITIADVTGGAAHAFYQIFDKAGANHGDGVICGKRTMPVPVGATQLAVYVDSVTLGAVGCPAPQGPTGGTTGEIRIVFDQGSPRPRPRHNIDTEQECLEPVPASMGRSGVSDAGQQVKLNVYVLLDGVAPSLGREVFKRVAAPYIPLDIDVVPSGFRPVRFQGKEASGLISQAKALFGGVRPKGSDVVYTITSKDIEALGLPGVAGLADCLGGVRFANRAFAVGEVVAAIPAGPFVFYGNGTAKTAAHEIGHLLGAHHHYANCVESVTTMSAEEPTPCTLMSNFLDFLSFRFGAFEGAVIRGHTVDYASP